MSATNHLDIIDSLTSIGEVTVRQDDYGRGLRYSVTVSSAGPIAGVTVARPTLAEALERTADQLLGMAGPAGT
jgi:hypothetical protein